METHNITIVDDRIRHVVGGQEFDNEYNHCILPNSNDEKLDDLHQSAGSPKPRARKHTNVPNVVKSDIEVRHVVISKLILMQFTKVISSRLKI